MSLGGVSRVSRSAPRTVPPVPDAAALNDAALAYLARYAATESALRRVLLRKIDRWVRAAEAGGADADAIGAQADTARATATAVVARLAAAGAVSDAAFAESRARSLARAGRSQRAIAAQLAAKGVDAATRRQALPEDAVETELAAALVLARRRRIGPFRAGAPPDMAGRQRELGMFARAGFSRDVAERALHMARDDAEDAINRLRR